jgi:arabinofuranosyltransferase
MPPLEKRLRILFVLLFLWVLLRNAWVCEDAFITYRVVDNLVHGLGARWNPLERVQVYTHPLWMLALSGPYLVTRDAVLSAMGLSLVCSTAAVWLLLSRGLATTPQRVLAIILVTFSKGFVDYSTGGLENPLTHLLLVLFFLEYQKPEAERQLGRMAWYAGLGLTNRMDLVWFFLPALVEVGWSEKAYRPRRLGVWVGLAPFVAWEAFAVLYYGFLFPNSAYAKLTSAIPWWQMVRQGVYYLINSLAWDPLTLFTVAALLVVGFSQGRSSRIIALSVALYLAYVLRIGGDYMSGRLLSAPFLVSLFLLSRLPLESSTEIVLTAAVPLALGVFSPRPPIQMSDTYTSLGSAPQSVDDERGYRHETSLLRMNKDKGIPDLGGWVADAIAARQKGTRVSVYKNVGYYGFFAGPGVHVIDPYGLGDPLMARLPFTEKMGFWASGHFYRHVPEGYPEAAIDAGTIKDPAIAAQWEKLKLVTRGPILSPERLREVVRFNLGMNRP